eukprot:g8529.t1
MILLLLIGLFLYTSPLQAGNVTSPDEDTPVKVIAHPEWISTGDWYQAFAVKLHNLTNKPLNCAKLQFKLDKGTPQVHTGADGLAFNDGEWTSYLSSWKLPLPANEKVTVVFGVNYSDGSGLTGTLPTHFKINDNSSIPEEDTVPPSIPTGIELGHVNPHSASFVWDPSVDNFGVTGYSVSYFPSSNPSLIRTENTEDPQIRIAGLDTNQEYGMQTTESIPGPEPIDGRLALPYTDGLGYPTPNLLQIVSQSGVSGSFVGFVVDRSGVPTWGGHTVVYDSNTGIEEKGDARVSNYHKEFFSKNQDSFISIGGAAGLPPASNSSLTPEELCNHYKAIIDNYGLKGLDFEGGFLADTNALRRHIQAAQQLLIERPETRIVYTLPVDGSPGLQGFNFFGENFINAVREAGIKPYGIQCMLMEFGQGSNDNLFEASKVALEGAHGQIKSIFEKHAAPDAVVTDEEIWSILFACPMYGRNNNGKVFTLENQVSLNQYCIEKGMPVMSGWDTLRDTRMTPEQIGVPNHTPSAFGRKVAEFAQELKSAQALSDSESEATSEAPRKETVAGPIPSLQDPEEKKEVNPTPVEEISETTRPKD